MINGWGGATDAVRTLPLSYSRELCMTAADAFGGDLQLGEFNLVPFHVRSLARRSAAIAAFRSMKGD